MTTKAVPRTKTKMTAAHKAALAQGREEGRTVRVYLEAIEKKPGRGRRRTPETIQRRLGAIDSQLPDVDPLTRLHLVEERQRLSAQLEQLDEAVDIQGLEKAFTKVAKSYGERKGISYSSWRTAGVSASVLKAAKIQRSRG